MNEDEIDIAGAIKILFVLLIDNGIGGKVGKCPCFFSRYLINIQE